MTVHAHLVARHTQVAAAQALREAELQPLRDTAAARLDATQTARQLLFDAEQELQAVRDQLALLQSPAAGHPLLEQLQHWLVMRSRSRAALLLAEERELSTAIQLAELQDAIAQGQRRLQQLAAQRDAEQAPQAARQALLASLAGARLAVQDEAQAALAAEGAAARARLLQDLPAELLDGLAAHQAAVLALEAEAPALQQALLAETAAAIPERRLGQARSGLQAAVEAGRALAEASVADAVARLAQLAAANPLLDTAARAALALAVVAPAGAPARAEVLARQASWDAARLALAQASDARRAGHLRLQLEAPDDFPPIADPRLSAYTALLDAEQLAHQAFESADNGYSAAHREALDHWLAGLPEALAERLARYLAARATLQALHDAQAAQRRDAITDAETALIAALRSAEQAQLRGPAAARALQAQAVWLAGDPGGGGRRLAQALRGAP